MLKFLWKAFYTHIWELECLWLQAEYNSVPHWQIKCIIWKVQIFLPSYLLEMQNINNRIQISGKTDIRANEAELQYHSPLCSMQCPGSCHSDTWSTCTTLSLCTGLPWKPNSKSAGSRSLLALCETVAGINTAVRHCLIGFFVQVCWMTVFSLLSPPLPIS